MLRIQESDSMESKKTPIRKLQLAEIDILKEFIKICNENNYRYFLLGGTFLGAVRHKGFIPWDDDIDIGMPRSDFELFLKYMKNKKNSEYELRTFKDAFYTSYVPKFVNKKIKVVDFSSTIPSEQYAWIDIFPLDGMPKSQPSLFLHKYSLLFLRLLLNYSRFSTNVNIKKRGRKISDKFLILLGFIIPFEKFLNTNQIMYTLDRFLTKYEYETSHFVVNFMGAYRFKEMFNKSIYDETSLYEFEEMDLPAPKNFQLVLSQLYGDYMKLPSLENRESHNLCIIEES